MLQPAMKEVYLDTTLTAEQRAESTQPTHKSARGRGGERHLDVEEVGGGVVLGAHVAVPGRGAALLGGLQQACDRAVRGRRPVRRVQLQQLCSQSQVTGLHNLQHKP